MSDDVLLECSEGIATITVNRPDKRNSMDIPTRKQLREAFETAEADDQVRVVVLRGAGENNFIAGGDIESFARFDLLEAKEYFETHAQGLYNYIAHYPKPTIAAIDGYAIGGGFEISCACDIRVAQRGVKLGLPEVTIGILPGGGGTQRLANLVGASVAKDMILTGKTIDAAEGEDIGFVNYLYDQDEFDDGVADLAESIAENAPIALELAKESINRGLNEEAGLDFEYIAATLLFATDDQQEGAEAFLEDRRPDFQGR